jgi:hypothetical protein
MPFWFLGFATILGLTREGYDPLRDAISRLGEQGAANSLVWQLGGFFTGGVLELGYAGALWSTFRGALMTGLMVAIAALLATSAAAPMPMELHMIAGLVLFACLALLPLAAWRQFRRLPEWADLSRGSLVVGVVLVVWFLMQPNFEPDRLGLWQRAFLVVALGWQVIVASRVRRLARRSLGPA